MLPLQIGDLPYTALNHGDLPMTGVFIPAQTLFLTGFVTLLTFIVLTTALMSVQALAWFSRAMELMWQSTACRLWASAA